MIEQAHSAETVEGQRKIAVDWDQMALVDAGGLCTYLGLELHAGVAGSHNNSDWGLKALEALATVMELH